MRSALKMVLIGATVGWAGAAAGLAASGILNIGGMLPGAIIALGWLAILATGRKAHDPSR